MNSNEALADASGTLARFITRLHPALREFVANVVGKDRASLKLDFSELLKVVLTERRLFEGVGSKSLFRIAERCQKIRNLVAHQKLRPEGIERALENMTLLAGVIGREDLVQEFKKSNSMDNDPMKDLDASLLSAVEVQKKKSKKKKKKKKSSEERMAEHLMKDGDARFEEKKWLEAMNCFTRALHKVSAPASLVASLYMKRALCEIRLDKLELAREDLEDAVEREPSKQDNFHVLSDVLLKLNLAEEARAVCESGLALNPRDPVLLERKRDCGAILGQLETNQNPRQVMNGSMRTRVEEFVAESKKRAPNPEDVNILDMDGFKRFASLTELVGKAHALEKSSHFQEALKVFEEAAGLESAEGLYNLGLWYERGTGGLVRDFVRKLELCRKAASQKPFHQFDDMIFPNLGVAEAENAIGISYREGAGIDIDLQLAASWFLRSAEHGCPGGENNFGFALKKGHGVKQSDSLAKQWYLKAAKKGLPEAQLNYACEVEGENVMEAKEWYEKAAAQGVPEAIQRLQSLARAGYFGMKNRDAAAKFLDGSVKKGDHRLIFLMGLNFFKGEGGMPKSREKALEFFREAANLGNLDACVVLGNVLTPIEAFPFWLKAATEGEATAQERVGWCYATGSGCVRSAEDARRWFLRAKRQGQVCDEEIIDHGEKVEQFERKHNLNALLPWIDRSKRYFDGINSDPLLSEFLEKSREMFQKPPPEPFTVRPPIQEHFMSEMNLRALNGSESAKLFLKGNEMRGNGTMLLLRGELEKGLGLHRRAYLLWDLDTAPASVHSFIRKCANDVLHRNPRHPDALYMLIRESSRESAMERVKLAQRCVSEYPREADFHHILCCMYGFAGDWENALRSANRAIELDSSHNDWLYDRATALRLVGSTEDAIQAYELFLQKNPSDHRKVPEALYCIAHSKLLGKRPNFADIVLLCNKAMVAQDTKIRLPCLPHFDNTFPPKVFVELTLKMWSEKNAACASCGKVTAPSRCACTHARYCNKQCQLNHWDIHRLSCTKKK